MAQATAALLRSNSSRHHTISKHPAAAKEVVVAAAKEAVAAAPKGDSSNSAMAISVTPVSAATTAITDDAGAISVDAADNVRKTHRAAVEAVVVAAEEEDKSRHLVHRSLP